MVNVRPLTKALLKFFTGCGTSGMKYKHLTWTSKLHSNFKSVFQRASTVGTAADKEQSQSVAAFQHCRELKDCSPWGSWRKNNELRRLRQKEQVCIGAKVSSGCLQVLIVFVVDFVRTPYLLWLMNSDEDYMMPSVYSTSITFCSPVSPGPPPSSPPGEHRSVEAWSP